MNPQPQGFSAPSSRLTGKEIRALNGADLTRLGRESLETHLIDAARRAHVRYHALSGESLYGYLSDPDFIRYPVRLVFELGSMAPHQFAQPERDTTSVTPAFTLFLHPELSSNVEAIKTSVAYFSPIMNFGKMVTEEMAVLYGATLLGMPQSNFYENLCQIADSVGATACYSGETHRIV